MVKKITATRRTSLGFGRRKTTARRTTRSVSRKSSSRGKR